MHLENVVCVIASILLGLNELNTSFQSPRIQCINICICLFQVSILLYMDVYIYICIYIYVHMPFIYKITFKLGKCLVFICIYGSGHEIAAVLLPGFAINR